MQEENMQELMNFIQATIKLDNHEIKKRINEEMGDKLSAVQVEDLTKQVLEIKESLLSGSIPDL